MLKALIVALVLATPAAESLPAISVRGPDKVTCCEKNMDCCHRGYACCRNPTAKKCCAVGASCCKHTSDCCKR